MESETSIALILGMVFLAIALLTTAIALGVSYSRRKLLEKENKMQLMEKQKQFELFNATVQTEENEKQRIAADLHDEIAPLIAATTRNINFQISEWEKKGMDITEIKSDMEILSTISGRIREVSHGLVPKLFSTFGLLKSIEAFIKNVNKSSEGEAQFVNNTTFSGKLPLTANDQLLIFRVCTELISNLNKHSNFDYLTISLEEVSHQFILLFTHDGNGITNAEIDKLRESGNGLGLKSLQSRTILLNASIDYYTEDGVSYIKFIVPVKP
jgi:two-component system, NarL family, sensor kinase